jgi:hypothetical protein
VSAIHGPPQRDPDDLTISEALERAQKDYARLLHLHSPSWQIDLTGAVRYYCSCSESTPRNADALDRHILEAVRTERGPVRPPQKR